MALFNIQNIQITGIATALPKRKVSNFDSTLFTGKEKELVIKTIGISSRRIANRETTASDLCMVAAEKLLSELNWQRKEVNVLVFVTQTPDYITPASAVILQDRLRLPKSCVAFDVNLGCSGYVYGLSIVSSILKNIPGGKGLLLVGDKSSQLVSKKDKSTALLFSDAGSATSLEHTGESTEIWFELATDGSGKDTIIVEGGAARHPFSRESLTLESYGEGIVRSELHLIMKGINILNFSIKEVVPSIRSFLTATSFSTEQIDFFVFHQANKIINDAMRKKLDLPIEKVPQTLNKYGNASSASIPLTISSEIGSTLQKGSFNLLLSGFGVGLSWANAIVKTDNLHCPPPVEV